MPEASRAKLQKWVRKGRVRLDGKVVVRSNGRVRSGAVVEVGASIRDTVVGARAVIGAHCELRNNMRVWPDVSLPPHGIRFSPDV